MRRYRFTALLILSISLLLPTASIQACGGFFCTDTPVDQAAERIIFAVNDTEGTITAYVQINYTGDSESFSWVVPVPNEPQVDVAEIESFDELSTLTAPRVIFPSPPDCFDMPLFEAAVADNGAVDVLQQGSVGPYDYAVIDGAAAEMVTWLQENGYRITPEMEPLVEVYSQEGMVFLAMKLSGGKGAQDIQPVAMTYRAERPMIPIRLTAVAATPDMPIITWIFGESQAIPENLTRLVMRRNDLAQTDLLGNHNYNELRSGALESVAGQGLVTEFAQPTSAISSSDPLISSLIKQYPYLTRVYGEMSPEEMITDPVFNFSAELPDISNVFDLTDRRSQYNCETNDVFSVRRQQIDASKGNRATPEEATQDLRRGPMRILTLTLIAGMLGFIGWQALRRHKTA